MKKIIILSALVITFFCQNLFEINNIFGAPSRTTNEKNQTQTTVKKKSNLTAEQRRAILTSKEAGCSCGWLKACAGFDCGPWCGFCADSSGKACSICLCKTGGMSHCSNWNEIINDPDCKDLKEEYCHGGNSNVKACNNDPVCQ